MSCVSDRVSCVSDGVSCVTAEGLCTDNGRKCADSLLGSEQKMFRKENERDRLRT